jgi:hypothetical protein
MSVQTVAVTLGAFTKQLRKAPIRILLFVCPSTRPHITARLQLEAHLLNFYWLFNKIYRPN